MAGISNDNTAPESKQKGEKTGFAKPKIVGLKQLLQKQYDFIDGLSAEFVASFGRLVRNFIMTVWGESGNGKSNFLMQLLKELMKFGDVLYVSLEEGTESTMQIMALRHLSEESHSGKIKFADNSMTYEALMWQLSKKKQAQFIVIDSIQYWDIDYKKYKALKERFPKKTFIFISHNKGKNPDGVTANKIRFDGPIKVRVEGYVAFIVCRYGGNMPYVIWEEGARKYWGPDYNNVVAGKTTKKSKPKKDKAKKAKKEVEDVN